MPAGPIKRAAWRCHKASALAIWSGAMMLRQLGVPDAADAVENAIANILAQSKVRTPDIGGISTTKDLGTAIALQVST